MTMARDLSKHAVHTMTNKPWSLAECCDAYAAAGFGGIGVWRNVVGSVGADEAARIVKGSGLRVPALVRGGFFVSADAGERRAAVDENRRCLDEAAAIGAESVVLVVGAEPGVALDEARSQVTDGVAACVPHAEAVGVRLAIEPLHPMYAGDKSCVNTTRDARLICERIGSPVVGVAVDVYHTWWDPDLESEIARLGAGGRLFGFHVCDWRVPTRDLLTDRALPGDGCIDIASIARWVAGAGFAGLTEIEVFSEEHWAEDQHDYLRRIAGAVTDGRAG